MSVRDASDVTRSRIDVSGSKVLEILFDNSNDFVPEIPPTIFSALIPLSGKQTQCR